MSEHAFLAPSSAARWVVCPGSAAMEARYPEQGDRPEAAEGTAAHWVMECRMLNRAVAVNEIAPNGVSITREMLESADLVANDVYATLGPLAHHLAMVERRIMIPRVHAQNWGTPDIVAWVESTTGERILYVWDFKFGHGHVEVFENWQLMDYALGCLTDANEWAHRNNVPAFPETSITVVLRVVQPRSYHRDGPIREWKISAMNLLPYAQRLHTAAMAAMEPNAACVPSPDACEHCTGRHACEALQTAAYRGIDLARRSIPLELSPAALGLELRLLTDAGQLMEARRSGLAQQAESVARKSISVPHWTLMAGVSRRKWNKPDAEVIALGEMMGIPVARPAEAITPTQAVAAGIPEELIAAYSFRPPGAMKLTLDDGTELRKTFAPGV